MDILIQVTLAGLTFPCRLRYSETQSYFRDYLTPGLPAGDTTVCLTEEDWEYYAEDGMSFCANTEFSLLTAAFSDALMHHQRLILHAVAIRRNDRAYLIAGPSGVGKSTQAKTLQALRPGEFEVICGDRPILQFSSEEGTDAGVPCLGEPAEADGPPPILVHPSPWNGKEGWHGADPAPLAGVILLQRGEENDLRLLLPRAAAARVYAQVIQNFVDPSKIHQSARLTDVLLKTVPVWQLTTHQVPDSTRLLLETVFKDTFPMGIENKGAMR